MITITGHEGRVGNILFHRLIEEGYEVEGTEDVDTYDFSKSDTIIHCAALVSVEESWRSPERYLDTNYGLTKDIRESTDAHIVLLSTAAVYSSSKKPKKETDRLLGNSPYAKSKILAEQCLNSTDTILRLGNVAGFSKGDGLIPNLVNHHLCDAAFTICSDIEGTGIRDYIHVVEVCDAIVALLESNTRGVYNIGRGEGRSVGDVISAFDTIYNVTTYGKIERQKSTYSILDISKIKSVWEPQLSFEETISLVVDL